MHESLYLGLGVFCTGVTFGKIREMEETCRSHTPLVLTVITLVNVSPATPLWIHLVFE